MKKLLLVLVAAASMGSVVAQNVTTESLNKKVDSLAQTAKKQTEEISKFQNWMNNSWAKNLKLSGYIQMQWQMAQEKGQDASYNGGNFSSNSDNRFLVRRARLKAAYKTDYYSAAIQINAGEKGVTFVEAAANFHLPNEIFAASIGQVYLPFTYYLDYSSSARMQPEIPRIVRAMLPEDTGLGAQVVFKGKKGTKLNDLDFAFGVYSQNGIKSDINPRKRILTRLQYNTKYKNGLSWGLMGGFQYGGAINVGSESYKYIKGNGYVETADVKDKYNNAIYYDLGAKIGFKSGAGTTSLMGEYLWGTQPGSAKSNATIKEESVLSTMGAVYNRKFNGYYANLEHKIAKTNLSFMARFDSYDPNSQISASQIGVQSKTGAADIKFTTLGTGLAYDFLKGHLRLVAYYEFLWNEKTPNLPAFATNVKDNLFTIRVQAKL